MPKTLPESLIGMVDQLGKAQETNIKEIRDDYDAKITKMMNAMGWLAKKGNIEYDSMAGFGEADEPPDTTWFPENPRDRGLC